MSELKTTPLNETHRQLGGKMVDFAGWEMPIQYKGVIAEHKNTREAVSLFDVSHMGEIYFEGKDALTNLQKLTCNDVSKMQIGQVQYSALLYENGTFVDDITVYRLAESSYFLCVNASNVEKNFLWIQSHLQGDLLCENRSSQIGQIAIQGQKAINVLQQISKESLEEIKYYWFREMELCGFPTTVARMGYTGEDGFEIYCPQEHTVAIWEALMEKGQSFGIAPAGLGARDTLRLEVCFPLYGQDIDDQHLPLEAGLGRFVALEKGDFIGKDILQKTKKEGIQRKLIRFVLDVRGVPRSHYLIYDAEGQRSIGEVSSGTSSPTLGKGIGMGYVPIEHSKIGNKINIQIRNKMVPASIVKPPFVTI
ncbi:MAG: glycine cleavage system aminomethyltransferase GcvT [SAR324 cluster bacterium]|nr:glycine cleavage system aminomethyltransferase GcvT [SAR324 cluster bacterium]